MWKRGDCFVGSKLTGANLIRRRHLFFVLNKGIKKIVLLHSALGIIRKAPPSFTSTDIPDKLI